MIQGAPAFESWLLSEQRHVAAASEAILHEAALGSMSRGEEHLVITYAISASVMNPLDENHQALVIRLYRLTGNDVAAEQQFPACTELFLGELGVAPGPAVHAAMRETRDHGTEVDDPASAAAIVEAGSAAVSAGAIEAGVQSLHTDLDVAAQQLDASIGLAGREHWLAILPWPQALRGEVRLARNDPAGAEDLLRQAFARACQLGDPCWEGMAARGLAMAAEATGETARAFELLADARARSNRLADPYVWLDGYILDAQCSLGVRHDHPDTGVWVDMMWRLTSRTAMREFTVRSLLYGAARGHDGDAAAAVLLGAEVENPSLHQLLVE